MSRTSIQHGTTEAFSRVKIDALLSDDGWNLTDGASILFEHALGEVTWFDTPKFTLEKDLEPSQKEEAMHCHDHLDPWPADPKHRLRDFPNEPELVGGHRSASCLPRR